jgi:G3E family GTPase
LENTNVQLSFKINAIVTVVDAINHTQHLSTVPLYAKQIAYANVVLISKTEALSADELSQVSQSITRINNDCKVVTTAAFNSYETLLTLNAFTLSAVEKLTTSKINFSTLKPSLVTLNTASAIVPQANEFSISSKSIALDTPHINPVLLDRWLFHFLNNNGDKIYRAKGIFSIENEDKKLVFQAIHDNYMLDFGPVWKSTEERKNVVVFIGEDLNKMNIEDELLTIIETIVE